jgi:chaperonin cofactor prefoldin
MNEADIKHYEQIQEMLMTDGWKNVEKELSELVEAIGSIEAVKNSDELFYKKGQLNIANLIMNLPHTVDSTLDVLKEDSQDD